MAQMETDPPDITNSCEERNRLSLEIEALDIHKDSDSNHILKNYSEAPTNANNGKKKKKKKKRKINKKDSVEDFVFPKKTARPVSPLPSEPVTVNKSFSDLESKNDKESPEENNETAPPKPKPPTPNSS
ncbi:hypothetical protein TNCV_3184241 [Trichonephila clavipes]|nr:hypothetical protein TNCV_3184241 [Trichonephila clavipes]